MPDNFGPADISQHSLIQSDHFMLSFTLSTLRHFQKPRSVRSYVPDFSKLDYTGLCDHLLSADFSDCLLSTDTEFIWGRLSEIICEAIDVYAPKVKIRAKNNSPCWWNAKVYHQ